LPAAFIIIVWAITGPIFHYSDTWQLIINTGTTIITFLMVFIIQNIQNRDSAAVQAKLDELIRVSAAQNALIGIEHLTQMRFPNAKESEQESRSSYQQDSVGRFGRAVNAKRGAADRGKLCKAVGAIAEGVTRGKRCRPIVCRHKNATGQRQTACSIG